MTAVAVLTLIIVAWLTAAATAVRSVSRIWLRHWVERRLSGADAAVLFLDRPHRMLLAATTGVSLTVFVAGVHLQEASRTWIETSIRIALYAAMLLVVGQLIPRAVGRRWPTLLIPVLLPPVRALDVILSPLLTLVRRITGERRLEESRVAQTSDEAIEELLREGELEGVGGGAEIRIISGVVQFGEKQLRDVMTPRSEVFAVEASLPPEELARKVAQSGFSRVPLLSGDLDHVIGMVHVFDLLKLGDDSRPRIRPVGRAPVTASCNEHLFRMLRERQHFAVVTDETGRTAGIVTLEDLLEELVGDIRDEHDEPGSSAPADRSAERGPA